MLPRAKQPSQATLKKYGLSTGDWNAILTRQGGVCAICYRLPSSGRLVVDHEHVRGFKRFQAAKRRLHTRGLLCWICNLHLVRKGMTPGRLKSAADYLTAYANRWLGVEADFSSQRATQ